MNFIDDIKKTDEWELYERGVEWKHRNGFYSSVDENYRFFEGDQWHGLKNESLPTPVFNIIKSVIRYKVSTIKQNDTKIVYRCTNTESENYEQFSEVAEALTEYAAELWERLKMDFKTEQVLFDAAIAKNGIMYFYFDEASEEVTAEIIDSTNIYPSNPNSSDVQDQDWIIIAFRQTLRKVIAEAKKNGVKDLDNIVPDSDNLNLAGDKAKIEQEGDGMCTVLLKLWKDDEGIVWFKKSLKNCVITESKKTGQRRYPIASMCWEEAKNCFFGVSDVEGLIPNQVYINKIAAMIMLSTMYTAFPKMVYNAAVVDNPTNKIGVAIPVSGGAANVKEVIDYINPAPISADAFNMFSLTLDRTKELMGANDGALGNINPEQASGRSILAVVEQSAVPLDGIKRRYYNFIEDIALIWFDIWNAYTVGYKDISYKKTNGEIEGDRIYESTLHDMMLSVKIDVGATSRWAEAVVNQTLDNMLANGFIPFDLYVELLPENLGIPKKRIQDFLEQQKLQTQQEQEAAQAGAINPQMSFAPNDNTGGESFSENDIDALLSTLTPEEQQEALQNPQMLEEYIANMLNNN